VVHERLRPVVRFRSPSRRARFAGFRGGAGSGQLRVVAARGGGTKAGFGVDVGWRFARKSAGAWLGREWKVLELAGPQPICSPILGPPRNYNLLRSGEEGGFCPIHGQLVWECSQTQGGPFLRNRALLARKVPTWHQACQSLKKRCLHLKI